VLVGLLLAAAFGLWLERSEDDRVRGIHLSFAAGGLLLALTAAVAGFAILP